MAQEVSHAMTEPIPYVKLDDIFDELKRDTREHNRRLGDENKRLLRDNVKLRSNNKQLLKNNQRLNQDNIRLSSDVRVLTDDNHNLKCKQIGLRLENKRLTADNRMLRDNNRRGIAEPSQVEEQLTANLKSANGLIESFIRMKEFTDFAFERFANDIDIVYVKRYHIFNRNISPLIKSWKNGYKADNQEPIQDQTSMTTEVNVENQTSMTTEVNVKVENDVQVIDDEVECTVKEEVVVDDRLVEDEEVPLDDRLVQDEEIITDEVKPCGSNVEADEEVAIIDHDDDDSDSDYNVDDDDDDEEEEDDDEEDDDEDAEEDIIEDQEMIIEGVPDPDYIKSEEDCVSNEELFTEEDLPQIPPQPLSTSITEISQLKDVSQRLSTSEDNVESGSDSGFVFWSELHLSNNVNSAKRDRVMPDVSRKPKKLPKKPEKLLYRCPYHTCQQSFATPLCYTNHITDNHMRRSSCQKNSTDNTSQFKCGYCDKTFRTEPVLKTHLMVHFTDDTDLLMNVQRCMTKTLSYDESYQNS